MEAIAKYDFKATADDELSFKRGDILKVSADVVASRAWLPFLTLVTHKDAVLSLSSVHTLISITRFNWIACRSRCPAITKCGIGEWCGVCSLTAFV